MFRDNLPVELGVRESVIISISELLEVLNITERKSLFPRKGCGDAVVWCIMAYICANIYRYTNGWIGADGFVTPATDISYSRVTRNLLMRGVDDSVSIGFAKSDGGFKPIENVDMGDLRYIRYACLGTRRGDLYGLERRLRDLSLYGISGIDILGVIHERYDNSYVRIYLPR